MRNGGRRRSLAGTLGVQAAFGVLVPGLTVVLVAYLYLSYRLDMVQADHEGRIETLVGRDVERHARALAERLDAFVAERIRDARAWAGADVVVRAADQAAARHAAVGLLGLEVDVIEGRFRVLKSLGVSPEADAYLKGQIGLTPHFAEIFFTDRNGFNVSMTNPTSDFVQSDEEWWQHAWSRGVSIGEVEYDNSAGVWSTDVSVRIGGEGLDPGKGVMKAVLAVAPVQALADRAAALLPAGTQIQVAGPGGLLIADTASGHARDRIMSPGAALQAPWAGRSRTGHVLAGEWLVGYARSGGAEAFAFEGVARHFGGLSWLVVVRVPAGAAFGALAGLGMLGSWGSLLVLSLAAGVLASALGALALVHVGASRAGRAFARVREEALGAARGDPPSEEPGGGPAEAGDLGEAIRALAAQAQGAREAVDEPRAA